MDANPTTPTKPRRGIYLLPNLLTTGALFAGFYAIVAAIALQFTDAVVAIFVAGVLDGLDGRVARLTNTQSEFGVQYDSLSDLVSFGVAPALVLYVWSLSSLKSYGPAWGKVGWAAAFIFAACGALRLARFNTQVAVADKRYFTGLAIPAAAGLAMSYLWAMNDVPLTGAQVQFITPFVAVIAGLLMVSRFRYFSFKASPKSERVPFYWILIAVLVLVALAINPPRILFAVALTYALSGPIYTLWGLHQRRGRHDPRPGDTPLP